jgi:hypothetical protein
LPKQDLHRGILSSWLNTYGFVVDENDRTKSYFLHSSSIIEGPVIPQPGTVVVFEIAPPVKGGKRPICVNARLLSMAVAR